MIAGEPKGISVYPVFEECLPESWGEKRVRFGTDLAIPGWTTTVFGFFGVFLFQLILIAIISVLSLLNNRSTPQVIPAADALRYIAERKSVHG